MMGTIRLALILAGLLTGCQTSNLETNDTLIGKSNPTKYLESSSKGLAEAGNFPYISQALQESNVALIKKHKNKTNIRAFLKKRQAEDQVRIETEGQNYKPMDANIKEGHLSHLLYWIYNTSRADGCQGIAVYNFYGALEGSAGDKDFPLCLTDEVLEKLLTVHDTKIILSLTPETEGMYAVVVPVASKLLGWTIFYYKF